MRACERALGYTSRQTVTCPPPPVKEILNMVNVDASNAAKDGYEDGYSNLPSLAGPTMSQQSPLARQWLQVADLK